MLNLTDREWKEFKVGDIFEFTRGKRITKAFASENIGNIPVIAGGESNNGILCYLDESCKNIRVLKNHCITVAAFGTAGCVHYHDYKCFIDDKALALNIINKDCDNKYINLFLTSILSSLKERYSYGRGVTVDRYAEEVIKLPITSDNEPDYNFMEIYIRERVPDDKWITKCVDADDEVSDTKLKLTDKEWEEFKLIDLFDIVGTKCIYEKDMEQYGPGKYPHVCNSTENNAITGYYNHYTEEGNVICTGDIAGWVTYQKENFTCGSHIQKLIPRFDMDENIAKFIVTQLRGQTTNGNYGYGRLLNKGRLKEISINLPIKSHGIPDYELMHDYMLERERVIIKHFKKTLIQLKN